jgi:hypothetical protein
MCETCYAAWWRQQNPDRQKAQPYRQRRASCHPTRKVRARGLCDMCYRRLWRSEPEHRARERSYSREYQRRKSAKLDGRGKFLRTLYRYGLTFEDWSALVLQQGGRCAACNDPTPDLQVDHCHERGLRHVRGLLCGFCNSALGYAKDDVDRLHALIDYLLAVG